MSKTDKRRLPCCCCEWELETDEHYMRLSVNGRNESYEATLSIDGERVMSVDDHKSRVAAQRVAERLLTAYILELSELQTEVRKIY